MQPETRYTKSGDVNIAYQVVGSGVPHRHPSRSGSGRVLITALFTDVVRSTERAAALGDRAWRELLDEHNRLVRRELERFRGREVDTAGDGFLATFDGPDARSR